MERDKIYEKVQKLKLFEGEAEDDDNNEDNDNTNEDTQDKIKNIALSANNSPKPTNPKVPLKKRFVILNRF